MLLQLPKVWLFFGCRTESVDLYREEKEQMVERNILDRVFLALSREQNVPKVWPWLFIEKNKLSTFSFHLCFLYNPFGCLFYTLWRYGFYWLKGLKRAIISIVNKMQITHRREWRLFKTPIIIILYISHFINFDIIRLSRRTCKTWQPKKPMQSIDWLYRKRAISMCAVTLRWLNMST